MSTTTAAPTVLAEGAFRVDPEGSSVGFSVAHFRLQTVRGTLAGLQGEVEVAEGRLHARGSVEAATITTGTPPRDEHLRSFLLAADRYPLLELRVDAALAPQVPATAWIRGRPVTVLVTIERAGEGLRASFTLDRRSAGLTWPLPIELGGVAVGRQVSVGLELALQPV